MKLACAFSLLVGGESASTSEWEAYKNEFGKFYNSDNEDTYRHMVFDVNLAAYDQLNSLEPLADYGPTVFSDMTQEEFADAALGYEPDNSTLLEEHHVDTSLEVARSRDWTGQYTSAIKNQGHCGSCWAFSAISQVESDAMREHGWTGTLSTQELVDCTEDGQGSKRTGCNGGNTQKAYKVLEALGGAAADSAYSYTGTDGTCKTNNYKKVVNVRSYKSVGRNDESTMKSHVSSTGPLSVCVDANDWGGYKKGIKTSCGTKTDHCVQIVGFGSDGSTDYWKVRNSWGPHWGEGGHMRLAIGKSLCNIDSNPTMTSTEVLGPSPSPSPHPSPSPSPSGCSDHPSHWKSSEGDSCSAYVSYKYCTADGNEGSGWNHNRWGPIRNYADSNGHSAFDACCGCGGGSHNVLV